jgi:hypothetical protein
VQTRTMRPSAGLRPRILAQRGAVTQVQKGKTCWFIDQEAGERLKEIEGE